MLFRGAMHKKVETVEEGQTAERLRFGTAMGLAVVYAGMVAAVDYLRCVCQRV